MPIELKRAGDASEDELFMKLLLYGDSGAGKTWMASAADKCAILLTERNGEHSIRMSNPDALYVYVTSPEQVREFFRAALEGELAEQGIKTLVVDGLTEIQRMFKDEIEAERGDGEFSVRDWGTLHEKVRGVLRMLRDLPYHVVCTALAQTYDGDEIHYVKPQFQGKTFPDEVMQYFNAVGYVFKRGASARGRRGAAKKDAEATVEHAVMFDGPARIKSKNCHPLRGTHTGRSQDFLDILVGARNTTPVAEPEPEEEKPAPKADPPKEEVKADAKPADGAPPASEEPPKEPPKQKAKPGRRRRLGA